MIRTITFFIILWLSLFLSILLFLPYLFLLPPFFREQRLRYLWFFTSGWSKMILLITGSRVKVTGKEFIPENPDFIIVSNHQAYMDIPLLMSVIPYPLSFVAKRELRWMPFINLWLFALDAILIDRSKSVNAYHLLKKQFFIKRDNPLLLFPEGSRSKAAGNGKNKKGGLKLADESGKAILKIELEGSYRIWEKERKIQPADVSININLLKSKARTQK